jgi:hypothetical protein
VALSVSGDPGIPCVEVGEHVAVVLLHAVVVAHRVSLFAGMLLCLPTSRYIYSQRKGLTSGFPGFPVFVRARRVFDPGGGNLTPDNGGRGHVIVCGRCIVDEMARR